MTMKQRGPRTQRRATFPLAAAIGLFAVGLGTTNDAPAQSSGAAAAAAPGAPSGATPRSRAQVTVNFVNADVEAVTRAMSAMIGR